MMDKRDMPSNEDEDWDYLSGILEHSNDDEDLTAEAGNIGETSKIPGTSLEAHIQNLTSTAVPLTTISGMKPGKIHIHGNFTQVRGSYLRRGLHITEAIIEDETGRVRAVWFNQPYKARSIIRDMAYEVRGNYALYRQHFQVSNAKIRPLAEGCAPFEKQSTKT